MDLVADENVPRAIVERLRRDGHSVVSIAEISAGTSDLAVMAASNARQFVLVTHDRDFGELAVARALPIEGVILLETERLSLAGQTDRISRCLAEPDRQWSGHFSVVEPSRIRQRLLR